MLEVIDKGQISETHSYPVLFLHGAWHGAWCWNEHFLDFFATQGFRVLAPGSLGHGSSPTGKSIRMCSIADFVSDLSSVIDSLPSPPILVGHSLGGFVIQKYLDTHDVPAAVLLASAPPRGQLSALMRSMRSPSGCNRAPHGRSCSTRWSATWSRRRRFARRCWSSAESKISCIPRTMCVDPPKPMTQNRFSFRTWDTS